MNAKLRLPTFSSMVNFHEKQAYKLIAGDVTVWQCTQMCWRLGICELYRNMANLPPGFCKEHAQRSVTRTGGKGYVQLTIRTKFHQWAKVFQNFIFGTLGTKHVVSASVESMCELPSVISQRKFCLATNSSWRK